VDEAGGVHAAHGGDELAEHVRGLALAEPLVVGDVVEQVTAAAEVHDQVHRGLVLKDLLQRHDALVGRQPLLQAQHGGHLRAQLPNVLLLLQEANPGHHNKAGEERYEPGVEVPCSMKSLSERRNR